MKARLLILGVVAAAVVGVVWAKQDRAPPRAAAAKPAAPTSVLLFADLREAGDDCGCADVIRLARRTRDLPGVSYQEFDARTQQSDAKRYGVEALPTVLILGPDGAERRRFEGEASKVIDELRSAVDALVGAGAPATRP